MTRLSVRSISEFLRSRGSSLNPGARAEEIDALRNYCGGVLDRFYEELYLEFNGHIDSDLDERSEISIWPIERILSYEMYSDGNRMVFADFSFSAHLYTASFSNSNLPVTINDPFVEIAESINDFFIKLIECRFDIV